MALRARFKTGKASQYLERIISRLAFMGGIFLAFLAFSIFSREFISIQSLKI